MVEIEEGRDESKERDILIEGTIIGFTGDLIINGIPGPRRDPQTVL